MLVPLFFPTDSHPLSLSDLLQNNMSTSHTIRAHAQEVWDKSDKDYGRQSGRKVVTHNSKSDLPLVS